ncbi:MAG: amidohydrolase family protein [Armatimonadota bacterium]
MSLPANAALVVELMAEMSAISTVDAHQHLNQETPLETDLCQVIVGDNYLATDLVSAGLTPEIRDRIKDPAIPLMERWRLLAPFWRESRHSSYAQAHLITYRECYGAQGLADEEIEGISTQVAKDFRAPGLFTRVFADRCGISDVLTQGVFHGGEAPRFHYVARPFDRADFTSGGLFEQDARSLGIEVMNADDLVPAMDTILRNYHAQGAIGFKMAAQPWEEPAREDLAARDPIALQRLYISRICTLARELNIPVAVHTGAPWSNWLDFRQWEPTAIIPLLSHFQDVRFDLYHAGVPFGTPFSMMGKAFPNVWLNLCWTHVISEELAMRSIAEWLDLAPCNKVIGFGGDYQNGTVALTYGHLTLARRNLARVLGYRITGGQLSRDAATEILRAWLSDNPRRLYHLA